MRTLRRRILLACALALVASLVVVASAAADIEPTNNRFTGAEGPLVGGVAVNGNISATGDEDWYYLYVGSTGDFTIATNAYTVVYKYDGGGLDELFYFNTSGGSTIKQWQPGLYYIRVYKNSAPKAYTLSVTGPTSSQPPSLANTHRTATLLNEIYEPADTGYRQAQLVTPYAENQAAIGASGDTDWYKFYVTSTCDVSVGLWTPHDLSLDVYSDPTKSELVWMRGPSSTWNRQLARGIYYVKVHEGTAPQEYTFSVQGQFVSLNAPALPAATVYTPVAPSTMYRGHSYSIYGYVAPRHTSGTYLATLKFYLRNSHGVYVYHHSVNARRYYYSTTKTKYKATVSLPHTGKWRVRAYHSCSKHAGSYSGYEYITVR